MPVSVLIFGPNGRNSVGNVDLVLRISAFASFVGPSENWPDKSAVMESHNRCRPTERGIDTRAVPSSCSGIASNLRNRGERVGEKQCRQVFPIEQEAS